jgi:site-specific recombinase XerD
MWNLTNAISNYISDKKYAWAETTKQSEASRLKKLSGKEKTPESFFEDGKATYGLKTFFIRASNFFDWAIERGYWNDRNYYKEFYNKNQRLFKNVYSRRAAPCSFEEAKRRIARIEDKAIRERAYELLYNGLRISESYAKGRRGDGTIYTTGKGSKQRRVFAGQDSESNRRCSRTTFRAHLGRVGLKPHDLRKLCATELYRRGALDLFSLCEAFGWSSVETARKYIQPAEEKKIEEAFRALKG